jgi:tetratricopeptide (TPR) repeat protein
MPRSKHRKNHKEKAAARRQELAATPEPGDEEMPVPSRADLEAYVVSVPAEERSAALAEAEAKLEGIFEAEDPEAQLEIVSEAMALSPLCVRGYLMMAAMLDGSLEETMPLYRVAADAAELAAGGFAAPGSLTDEDADYLWAVTAYADALWGAGDSDAAIALLRRVLEQAGDNDVGVQHALAPWLAELGRVPELAALLARYPEDDGLDSTFNRALLAFLEQGDTEATRAQVAAAVEAFPEAVDALIEEIEVWEAVQAGEEPEIDPDELEDDDPEREDAKAFAIRSATAWASIPGVIDWLMAALGIEEDEPE